MEKEILQTVRDETMVKTRRIKEKLKKSPSQLVSGSSCSIDVRAASNIPASVKHFFKRDPRGRRLYNAQESLFLSQVVLHEIDEGIRILKRQGLEQEAKLLSSFSNRKMHLTQRIELLRNLLKNIYSGNELPENASGNHKIRNNQVGSTTITIQSSPAVAWTDQGVQYKNRNEDAFLMISNQGIMALADGMGGHVGGEIASCIAIDFFEQAILQGARLEEAFVLANEAILTRSLSDPQLGGMHPMGCTFVAIQVQNNQLKIAHIGDSKGIVIRDGACFFETQDHTQGQELLHEGFIDVATAFELNHILNRCLGIDRIQWQRDVDLAYATLLPGDRIVLATDGVTDNFYDNDFELTDLLEIVSHDTIPQSAQQLAEECKKRMQCGKLPSHRSAKPDNFSFIILEYQP